jgi:hypothetical protein
MALITLLAGGIAFVADSCSTTSNPCGTKRQHKARYKRLNKALN